MGAFHARPTDGRMSPAEIDKLLAKQRAELEKEFQSRLNLEIRFGNVGRRVIHELKARGTMLPLLPDHMVETVAAKYITMGKDFDTLITAIKADIMLSSEWERFSMMLKLAQE
jgi:hypothetical protein